MSTLLGALAVIFILAGSLLVVVGSIGLIRFPDFFTRLHAASITDTLGAGLVLTGLILMSTDWVAVVKLGLVLAILLFTGPMASHSLAKTARYQGMIPWRQNQAKSTPASSSSAQNSYQNGPDN